MEEMEHGGEGDGCEFVGEGMADIAGIGILVGFIGQAIISLLLAGWVFFLSKHGDLEVRHAEGTVEREIEHRRLEMVSELLMTGNDIQMMLGISYMVTAFVSASTMDLYHLHLVFDIVSFVGVSNAAALVCWTFCASKLPTNLKEKLKYRPINATWRFKRLSSYVSGYSSPRHHTTYAFAALFLALTILLCVRLDEWSPTSEFGRCYHSAGVVYPGNPQPLADKVYVGVTAAWMLGAMASALFIGPHRRHSVLITAFLQFPVHLYMALTLRYNNQGKLEGEETNENGWDFGQTTATLLLGLAVTDILKQGHAYFAFERDIREKGVSKMNSKESRGREKSVGHGREQGEELEEMRSADGEGRGDDEQRLSEQMRHRPRESQGG